MDKAQFIGGFTPTQHKHVLESIELKKIARKKLIERTRQDPEAHLIIKSALKIFSNIEDVHTPATLEPLENTTHVLINSENATINLLIETCLKSSLRVRLSGFYKKQYFKKGPNFNETKETVRDIKSVEVDEVIRIKYGDFFEWHSNLIKALHPVIDKGRIEDPTKEKKEKENIWEFNF